MKRQGLYHPTIEEAIEISGIETLHPGGLALTRRTAEVAGLRPGLRVLDVSTGRGTQAVFYAREFGVDVTGIDLSPDMVKAAREGADEAGLSHRAHFEIGDSQALSFADATFDVVINECAVGIPDDSQRVLDEMVRVVRPGGLVVMHESTWRTPLSQAEKDEFSERYGTTPLESEEWRRMLERAGARELRCELDPWSAPENFWRIRRDREVTHPGAVLTTGERLRTVWRILVRYGLRGVLTALRNERLFYRTVRAGRLGYGLYWGRRPEATSLRS